MLARTPATLVYLSAQELGITERERAGLIGVRDDLASGRVKHGPFVDYQDENDLNMEWDSLLFNMRSWHVKTDCGTAHCIAGFMQARGVYPKKQYIDNHRSRRLASLFEPKWRGMRPENWNHLTSEQAVRAIDHFLAGARDECWSMALSDIPSA